MASRWETIGDAIVTSLNAASLSQSFTASRSYRPIIDLDVLEANTQPSIYVIPGERSSETLSRLTMQQRDYYFLVEVHRFVADPSANSNVDPWMTLTEEIEDHLMTAGSMGDGAWIGSENEVVFEPEELLSEHRFQSTVRVQYRVKQQ